MSEILMTVDEVAALFDVKPKTIIAWRHTGKIPFTKVNGTLRFPRDRIDNWIKRNTHQPARVAVDL